MAKTRFRDWLVDVVFGGLVGSIVGGLVAVNIVIYYGVDRGYEASLTEIFDRSALLGIIVLGTLAAGPVLGVLVAHVQRLKRSSTGRHSH